MNNFRMLFFFFFLAVIYFRNTVHLGWTVLCMLWLLVPLKTNCNSTRVFKIDLPVSSYNSCKHNPTHIPCRHTIRFSCVCLRTSLGNKHQFCHSSTEIVRFFFFGLRLPENLLRARVCNTLARHESLLILSSSDFASGQYWPKAISPRLDRRKPGPKRN